jgi:hypothetical protein
MRAAVVGSKDKRARIPKSKRRDAESPRRLALSFPVREARTTVGAVDGEHSGPSTRSVGGLLTGPRKAVTASGAAGFSDQLFRA